MKIARYASDGRVHFGILEGEKLRRIEDTPLRSVVATGVVDDRASVELLAPLEFSRIFAVGMNYLAHIREVGARVPGIPLIFCKPSTAVVGPERDIVYPREGTNVHFEGEIGVVIGRGGRRIAEADALRHVLGYTCANDVSERVIQKREMKEGALLMGKGFDSFCPLGPLIATGLDPRSIGLESRVNGVTLQTGNTSDLLFPVAAIIAYLSSAITLLPGDVILTGTPFGTGPIRPGDIVEIVAEGIGTLSNKVVAEA